MSDSRRKHPFRGLCADSDKWDKQKAHRRLRRRVKEELREGVESHADMKHVSSPWDMNKDGKIRISNEKFMRK